MSTDDYRHSHRATVSRNDHKRPQLRTHTSLQRERESQAQVIETATQYISDESRHKWKNAAMMTIGFEANPRATATHTLRPPRHLGRVQHVALYKPHGPSSLPET